MMHNIKLGYLHFCAGVDHCWRVLDWLIELLAGIRLEVGENAHHGRLALHTSALVIEKSWCATRD